MLRKEKLGEPGELKDAPESKAWNERQLGVDGKLLMLPETVRMFRRHSLFRSDILPTEIESFIYYNWPSMSRGLGPDIYQRFVAWESILAFLGVAKRYFNFRTKVTAYLARGSFPVYILHQSILVAVAYYVVKLCPIPAAQYF